MSKKETILNDSKLTKDVAFLQFSCEQLLNF